MGTLGPKYLIYWYLDPLGYPTVLAIYLLSPLPNEIKLRQLYLRYLYLGEKYNY